MLSRELKNKMKYLYDFLEECKGCEFEIVDDENTYKMTLIDFNKVNDKSDMYLIFKDLTTDDCKSIPRKSIFLFEDEVIDIILITNGMIINLLDRKIKLYVKNKSITNQKLYLGQQLEDRLEWLLGIDTKIFISESKHLGKVDEVEYTGNSVLIKGDKSQTIIQLDDIISHEKIKRDVYQVKLNNKTITFVNSMM